MDAKRGSSPNRSFLSELNKMIYKWGDELPPLTNVYVMSWSPVKCTIDKDYFHYLFFYDGVWATSSVREFWEKYPHRHPNCTLFELLTEKLKICDL